MTDPGGRGAHPRAARPARQTADLPPGYPQEYQRLVTLRDGRSVLIRPIQPGDAPALAEAIESSDADTIRRRFLGGHPQIGVMCAAMRVAGTAGRRLTAPMTVQASTTWRLCRIRGCARLSGGRGCPDAGTLRVSCPMPKAGTVPSGAARADLTTAGIPALPQERLEEPRRLMGLRPHVSRQCIAPFILDPC